MKQPPYTWRSNLVPKPLIPKAIPIRRMTMAVSTRISEIESHEISRRDLSWKEGIKENDETIAEKENQAFKGRGRKRERKWNE